LVLGLAFTFSSFVREEEIKMLLDELQVLNNGKINVK